MRGRGILLVQPTIFAKPEAYAKNVDPRLLEYVYTKDCRIQLLNRLYGNPPSNEPRTAPCCDNCHRSTTSEVGNFPIIIEDVNKEKQQRAKGRSEADRHIAKSRILQWRQNRFNELGFDGRWYSPSDAVLPDKLVNVLVQRLGRLTSLENVRKEVQNWGMLDSSVQELSTMLVGINESIDLEKERSQHTVLAPTARQRIPFRDISNLPAALQTPTRFPSRPLVFIMETPQTIADASTRPRRKYCKKVAGNRG